ncbi:MAG: polysaccharide pyruvyl transferase family protein [Paracraurococcus sp.]
MIKRVFVIYHSGEVYDRDCVRWYSAVRPAEIERLYTEYHNIGDSVVYDSTLKLLDFDEVLPIDPNTVTEEQIDYINAECAFGIIRGSNYLHSEMGWGTLDRFLSRLTVPFVAPGIGMQAPHGAAPKASDATARMIRLLAERTTSLGVRGEITAEFLWKLGVKNVRVVGCPSMFRSLKPTWQVDEARLERLQHMPMQEVNFALTLRREIGPDYTDNVPRYLAVQKALINEAFANTRLTLFAQGELFEKFFFSGRSDLYGPQMQELIDTGWASGTHDRMLDIYRKALYFSSDIPVFAAQLSKADFAAGFRVHGVLPSLAQGIPGVLVDYDKRTRELIDSFGIPHVSLESAHLRRVLEVGRDHDYGRISRKYAYLWNEMRDFFDENRIPHRMAKSASRTG